MIEIKVYGVPVSQGNHRVSKSGHIYETTKNHKPWREAVTWTAVEARTRLGLPVPAISGPVSVEMIFTMVKPKGAPKRRVTYPDKKPDGGKLQRSVEDALTAAGIIEDDGRIIAWAGRKVYPMEGVDALDVPGAVIRIRGVADVVS